MAELIERQEAIKAAEHAYNEWNLAMAAADGQRQINRVFKMQELCKAVISVFENVPAADVAPVVRCKDCKHSYEDIGGRVCAHGVCVDCSVPDDFFCAYGVKKAGGE